VNFKLLAQFKIHLSCAALSVQSKRTDDSVHFILVHIEKCTQWIQFSSVQFVRFIRALILSYN